MVWAVTAAVIGVAGSAYINSRNQSNLNQAAQTQGQQNLETARQQNLLNNPNVTGPYGSQSWTIGPDGRPSLTQTLSPDEQWAYNQNNALRSATNSRLMESFPNLTAGLSQPFGIPGSPMMGLDANYAPQPGDIQRDPRLGQAGPIQSGLDFSGAPGMPVASDATRQAVADAVYRQGARYLDPQFHEQQDAMTTALANQGITQGSVGAQRAQDAYDRSRTLAYGDLGDRATQQGIAAMNTLFSEQMAARQQGVNETTAQGQFGNAAQLQGVNELLASMQARNTAATTGANIANLSTGAYNAARQQAYNEKMTNVTTPINLYNSLRTGSQVNNPAFPTMTPTSITPPPTLAGAQGQAQINAANISSYNQLLGGGMNAFSNYFGQPHNPTMFSQPAAPITDYSTPAEG